jgi:hypothetical protein
MCAHVCKLTVFPDLKKGSVQNFEIYKCKVNVEINYLPFAPSPHLAFLLMGVSVQLIYSTDFLTRFNTEAATTLQRNGKTC